MRHSWIKKMVSWMGIFSLFLLIVGCGGTQQTAKPNPAPAPTEGKKDDSASKSTSSAKSLTPVKQVTNWFAQPEHGGLYAAKMKGFYEEAGLDMTIEPGGPKIQAAQMVASGKAQFGMMNADELLIARNNGLPLVAVFGTFQKNAQALMFHKDANIKDFADLNGRTVYVTPGSGYWEYIKKAYKLDKVKEFAYTGQLSTFLADKQSVTQIFVTSEPFATKQQGVDTGYLMIADSGYAPYGSIMVTTEQFLKEHPDTVKAYVQATIKGWQYYKDHYQEVNPIIKKANPDLADDAMDFASKTLQDLVYGGDAAKSGVGYMTEERWSSLNKILTDLNIIKSQDVKKAFTNDYR